MDKYYEKQKRVIDRVIKQTHLYEYVNSYYKSSDQIFTVINMLWKHYDCVYRNSFSEDDLVDICVNFVNGVLTGLHIGRLNALKNIVETA